MADAGTSEQISFYQSGVTTIFPNQSFGYYIQNIGSELQSDRSSSGLLNIPIGNRNNATLGAFLESDRDSSNRINTIFQEVNNGINIGPTQTTYYLMRWADPDCGSPTYRTWVVENDPDPAGLEYAGPKCGATPISGAIISATWIE